MIQAVPRAGSQLEVQLGGALVGWCKIQICVDWAGSDLVLGWVNYYRAQEPTAEFHALVDRVEEETQYVDGPPGMNAA